MTNQTAPILEYDSSPPPITFKRIALRTAMIFASGVCVALVVSFVLPPQYACTGYLQLTSQTPPATVQSAQAVQSEQDAACATILSSTPALARTVSAGGRQITQAQIQEHLIVRPVPQSRLIEVSFQSSDPKLAAAVTNAALRSAATGNLALVTPSSTGPNSQPVHVLSAFGFVVGCAVSTFIIFLRARSRRRAGFLT